jgi:ribonuclease HI
MNHSLYFDGASKSNPGKSSYGVVIYCNDVEIVNDYNYLGNNYSNNYAEYMGLIEGLKLAMRNNIKCLDVYGDSILVINQMTGLWRMNSLKLKELNEEAKEFVKCFEEVRFFHVKRELNKRADELANSAFH